MEQDGTRTIGHTTTFSRMSSSIMREAGPKRETASSSPSSERGPSDNSCSHNDSDGILSSLTNDDSSRKLLANPGVARSSEESLSSTSSDGHDKAIFSTGGARMSFSRGNPLEVTRKRKAQPVSTTPSVSSTVQGSSNMIVPGNSAFRENGKEPSSKNLKMALVGKRSSKDGKRSSRKKKDVNLTTVEGQLMANPGMSEEEAKASAKREYHRQNAALARVRNKEMVSQLKRTVSELTRKSSDLQRANDVLRSQLEIFSKQNADLVKNRTARTTSALAAVPAQPVETSAAPITLPGINSSVVSPPQQVTTNDASALLLLQVMSTLLQTPQGQVRYGTPPVQPQGVNLLGALLQGQANMQAQLQPPVATSASPDPQLLGQILGLLQAQQTQPATAPTPILPSRSPLSTSLSHDASSVMTHSHLPSDLNQLELLLALSSSNTSASSPTIALPQHSTQPSQSPSQHLALTTPDALPPQPARSFAQSVSNAASTPSPAQTETPPAAAGPPPLSASSQSSTDTSATSTDLQASQLMLLLRSLSQNQNAGQAKQL